MNPEEIKALRKSLGLSQEKFARLVGVTLCVVSRWERGILHPNTKNYIKLTFIRDEDLRASLPAK